MNFPPPSDGQARIIWTSLTGLAIAVLLTLIGAAVWGLGRALHTLGPVLWPIAIAGVLAYLLDPVVDALERRRVPRPRAIICVFALAVVLVVALAGSVVPQLVQETRELADRIPTYAAKLQKSVEKWVNKPPAFVRKFFGSGDAAGSSTNSPPAIAADKTPEPLVIDWGALLGDQSVRTATGFVAERLGQAVRWVFGQFNVVASFFGLVAGLALVPVYCFYLLLEKRGIESSWTDYLPVGKSGFKDELVFVLRAINDYLIVFFRGQVLVAMCDGALYTIGFFAIGLPYAVLLGVLAVPLTMIPFLGAIITCAAGLVIALVQYGDWLHPLLVLGVFGVVQALEGLVIQPKIIGDRVGLHPLTIIIAVMAGTTLLGGILGGILAIPFTAALRVLMFHYVWKRAEKTVRSSA